MSVRSTPFVRDATTGKRVTPWWLAYLLVVVVLILGVQGTVAALFASVWPVPTGSAAKQFQDAAGFGVAALLLLVWIAAFERRKLVTLGFRRPGRGIVTLLIGFIAGVVLLSIPTVFLWSVGAYEQTTAPADVSNGASGGALLILLAVAWVIQGGTEELLTRGFLLQSSAVKLPGWLAVLLPAVVFTLVHGVLLHPLPFALILLFALVASFIVLRQGALWIVIGFHAGWNFTLGNVFGIPVSGLPALSNSFMYLRPTPGAPDWLTGGSFGTEASLPAVGVLALVAGVAFLLYRRWDTRRSLGGADTESAEPVAQ